MCMLVGHSPRLARPLFDLGAPAIVALALVVEQRQQSRERVRGVADDRHFHRIAKREVARLEVDLHAARLPGVRQELRVRKVGADHEERIALTHHAIARRRAEPADGAGDVGQIVGQDGLA